MKLTTTLTLDGLVRALRWKAHDLAEQVETGRTAQARDIEAQPTAGWTARLDGRASDDVSRR